MTTAIELQDEKQINKQLPKGWQWVKLGDVINKPISGEWGDDEGKTSIIRTTNFTNHGKLNLNEIIKRNIPQNKIEQKRLFYGDTIIEKSGGSPNQPVGRVVFFDQKDDIFLCNNFTSIIRAKDIQTTDSLYLFWFLFLNHKSGNTLKYQNKTTGIINLQLERYTDELQIPLPPLEEQKRIAAILNKADRIRKLRKKSREIADTFLQSVFLEMFGDPVSNPRGWDVVELGEKINFLTSGSRGWAQYYSPHGKVFLRIQNIGYSRLISNEFTFVIPPISAESNRTKVVEGDLLLSITADLGRSAVIPKDFPDAYINQHLALLRLKNVNPFFVSFYMSSRGGQFQFKSLDREGVKSGLNFDDIKGFKIYSPPLALQNQFAEIVNKFEKQREKLVESERQAELLFQSLLERAFRGEL